MYLFTLHSPQTPPALGISFNLIIVWLGQVLPQLWDGSSYMLVSATGTQTPGTSGRLPDVYSRDLKLDLSDDPSKSVRAFLDLPTPAS